MPNSFVTIHNKAIVVDTHNDILTKSMENGFDFDADLKTKTHSDLKRFKKGGINAQFFALWCDENKKQPFEYAIKQIDLLKKVILKNPSEMMFATDCNSIYSSVENNKLAALIGIEGGHMIEEDLSKLEKLYQLGARYMTLTWNNSTSWAGSAADHKNKKGLSEFGENVIKKMNELGMMVDISHVNEASFWDAIDTSSKPILATHSNAYALCPHPRNLKDDQLKAIAKKDGVIQVNFYSAFLDPSYMKRKDAFLARHKSEFDSLLKNGFSEYTAENQVFINHHTEAEALRSPFSFLLDHIEYIIKLVGVDYVGLGADYDGMPSPPKSLDDVSSYPLISKALFEKGYDETEIIKILGGNFLRVFNANEVTT